MRFYRIFGTLLGSRDRRSPHVKAEVALGTMSLK